MKDEKIRSEYPNSIWYIWHFAILLHLKLDPYIVNGRKQPKSFDPALEKDIMGGQSSEEDDTMLCKRVVTKDRRYITQITCFEKGTMTNDQENSLTTSNRNAMRLPVFGKQQNGGALASLFSFPRRQLFGGTSIVKTFHIKLESSCNLSKLDIKNFVAFSFHIFWFIRLICKLFCACTRGFSLEMECLN